MTKLEKKKMYVLHILQMTGWKKDKFGHLQRVVLRKDGEKQIRLKIGGNSIRYEVKYPNGWLRLMSAYFKDIFATSDGYVFGFKR